mgnify:CR=1 FL=1
MQEVFVFDPVVSAHFNFSLCFARKSAFPLFLLRSQWHEVRFECNWWLSAKTTKTERIGNENCTKTQLLRTLRHGLWASSNNSRSIALQQHQRSSSSSKTKTQQNAASINLFQEPLNLLKKKKNHGKFKASDSNDLDKLSFDLRRNSR